MTLNVSLLRDSFELVLTRQPDLTHLFYEDLFAKHPEARNLFGQRSLEVQEKMLAEALVAVMDHLEDAAWLQDTLGPLGAKHAGYGVTSEMFGWAGESLLGSLAKVAGSDWTPALAAEWTQAYGAVVALMLDGYPIATKD